MTTILVAEDDKMQRRVVVAALANIPNVTILEAEDGKAAQEFLRSSDIDVAITDLLMPEIGGLELIDWAKEASPRTVWIILSSADSFENSVSAIQLSAFDFLSKPVASLQIEAATLSAMRQHNLLLERSRLDELLKSAL